MTSRESGGIELPEFDQDAATVFAKRCMTGAGEEIQLTRGRSTTATLEKLAFMRSAMSLVS